MPIREDIIESASDTPFKEIQAREIKQPDWIPPTVPKNIEVDPSDVFDLNIPDKFDIRPTNRTWTDSMLKKSANDVATSKTSVDQTKVNAKSSHLSEVKNLENRDKVGLETVNGVSKFLPIKSVEGAGTDKDIMSEFEIGYGVKIPNTWLKEDEVKWPSIQGVKVDVSEGITEEQATALSKEILDKAYASSEKVIPKWDKLTEREKTFWGDLTYNGGTGAIKKNTKALAAAKKGHTVEAMINIFNFIKAGGKHRRGLLNRRLSMYNQAALSISGAPVVSSYETKGDNVTIKFSNGFMTDKVSKKMAEKINGNDNQYVIKASIKEGAYKANKNYNFER